MEIRVASRLAWVSESAIGGDLHALEGYLGSLTRPQSAP